MIKAEKKLAPERVSRPQGQGERFLHALATPTEEAVPSLEGEHTRVVHFYGCKRLDRLESGSPENVEAIGKDFERIIGTHFEIAKDKEGKKLVGVVQIGNEATHGVSGHAILIASHVAMHTYPEDKYHRRATVSATVCCKEEQLDALMDDFGTHFEAESMIIAVKDSTSLTSADDPRSVPFTPKLEPLPAS